MVFILQFPTNVYPENECVDCVVLDDRNKVEFTFNGDFLGCALARFYDYETSTAVLDRYVIGEMGETIAYNGDTVTFQRGTLDALSRGKDYVMQLLLCQSNNGTATDMTLLRGVIQEDVEAMSTTLKIENNIGNIYEWNVSGSMCYPYEIGDSLITNLMLYVGGEGRQITSYNRDTGEVTLASTLTYAHSSSERYTIKTNYLTSPLYFFKCRSYPTTTCAISVNTDYSTSGGGLALGFEYTGTYSHSELRIDESLINNYQATLYVNETYTSETTQKVLAKTDKIYSQNINGIFFNKFLPYKYITNPLVENRYDGFYYKIALDIVSNDGMVSHRESSWLNLNPLNNPDEYIEITELSIEKKGSYNQLTFSARTSEGEPVSPSEKCVQCIRRNVKTNEFCLIPIHHASIIYDTLVPNKGEFEYTVIAYDVNTGRPYLDKSKTVSCVMDEEGYYVIALDKWRSSTAYPDSYDTKEVWHFIGEISDTTNVQNNDRYLQVGYGKYTQITSTDVNYMSGELSALLASVHCEGKKYEDDIELVRAWRNFVMHDGVYLLKSQKGDVWLVNLTNTQETNYGEMQKELPTTFSFSWAECGSTDDIDIRFMSDYIIR